MIVINIHDLYLETRNYLSILSTAVPQPQMLYHLFYKLSPSLCFLTHLSTADFDFDFWPSLGHWPTTAATLLTLLFFIFF